MYDEDAFFDPLETETLLQTLSGKFAVFVSSSEVFDLLSLSYPHLHHVSVSYRFPDGIHVALGSYIPVFRTQFQDESYLVMENGVLVPEFGINVPKSLPFITVVGKDV